MPYVNDYVNTFIGKSITTQQWKDHLYGYYEKNGGPEKIKLLDSIDWNVSPISPGACAGDSEAYAMMYQGWFFGEGLSLPVELEFDTSLAEKAYALA